MLIFSNSKQFYKVYAEKVKTVELRQQWAFVWLKLNSMVNHSIIHKNFKTNINENKFDSLTDHVRTWLIKLHRIVVS